MKCAFNNCGKETGKPCPPSLVHLQTSDPRTILLAFGPNISSEDKEKMDAMVCERHEREWWVWLVNSGEVDFSI